MLRVAEVALSDADAFHENIPGYYIFMKSINRRLAQMQTDAESIRVMDKVLDAVSSNVAVFVNETAAAPEIKHEYPLTHDLLSKMVQISNKCYHDKISEEMENNGITIGLKYIEVMERWRSWDSETCVDMLNDQIAREMRELARFISDLENMRYTFSLAWINFSHALGLIDDRGICSDKMRAALDSFDTKLDKLMEHKKETETEILCADGDTAAEDAKRANFTKHHNMTPFKILIELERTLKYIAINVFNSVFEALLIVKQLMYVIEEVVQLAEQYKEAVASGMLDVPVLAQKHAHHLMYAAAEK